MCPAQMPLDLPHVEADADNRRAYLVRGTDLLWNAKRICDGEIVASKPERADAKVEAERLGYVFKF